MVVVRIIATVKSKLEYLGKTCMFLGYAQNHTGGTYRMLNLCSKRIVLSRAVIWINKTYGEYVSRKESTNVDSYVLQEEDESNNYSRIKIDPVNN